MIELNDKISAAFKQSKEKADKGLNSTKKSGMDFNSMLENMQKTSDVTEIVKALNGEVEIKSTNDFKPMESESIDQVKPNAGEEIKTNAMQKIADIMGGVNDGQMKLQRLVDYISTSQHMSPQELLAIQASVYSLIQELELVGKATQEATQGIRQTMNTNLG